MAKRVVAIVAPRVVRIVGATVSDGWTADEGSLAYVGRLGQIISGALGSAAMVQFVAPGNGPKSAWFPAGSVVAAQ